MEFKLPNPQQLEKLKIFANLIEELLKVAGSVGSPYHENKIVEKVQEAMFYFQHAVQMIEVVLEPGKQDGSKVAIEEPKPDVDNSK